MSTALEPSATRGAITLQPSYFTSSLYVNPLREDISALIAAFSEQYTEIIRPFELFKKLWSEQGWIWLHLRVHDGRARQALLRTTERLFVERLAETAIPLERVAALFGLYTFHSTQPSTSAPPISAVPRIAIPIDVYEEMLSLPSALEESRYRPLKPYVSYVLTTMLDAQVFHILPHSSLHARTPSNLPREVFIPDGQESAAILEASTSYPSSHEQGINAPKKKGRPSKRDKMRKAKEALVSLEKYVDRNYISLPQQVPPLPGTPTGPTLVDTVSTQAGHAVFGQAPTGSLGNYLSRKNDLLATVYSEEGGQHEAVRHANEAVLARLKQIDEMAAEKGLEVGGEGGEKTGLERVDKAVEELRRGTGVGASGGILALSEGAGLDLAGSF
ncbi:hypothetical protein BD413DRAFT_601085 [Trametes elegans]|nr:hypothetical protein BD413DRAFT_601085 [Trametes elegans]